MSGRVRVTLSDGRRVTGFRKTLRMQARRTPRHLLPDWQLSFMLPDGISLHPDFRHGVAGAVVNALRHVAGHRQRAATGFAARPMRCCASAAGAAVSNVV